MSDKDYHLSPIAIDLGAKFTGVSISHLESPEELPTRSNTLNQVLQFDKDNFTLSQESRRQTRHRIRNKKRNKFVKKVAEQILTYLLKRSITSTERVAICHYLNNRGYTYLDDKLEEYVSNDVINVLSTWYSSSPENHIAEWLLDKMKSDEFLKDFQKKTELLSKEKEQKKTAAKIEKFISGYIKNYKEGHRHRKEYFKNIHHDISNDSRLDSIVESIEKEKLTRLLSHLSNMQWKNLHRYIAKSPQKFNADAFHHEFKRMLKSFKHPKNTDNYNIIKNFIQQFEESSPKEALTMLLEASPNLSIPPYEARTNTGMEKDQTLLLNQLQLNKKFPRWRSLIPIIVEEHPFLSEYLDHIEIRDRKRFIPKDKIEEKKDSYILQRYLDINKKIDAFSIKEIIRYLDKEKSFPNDLKKKYQKLINKFENKFFEDFIQIARIYNSERVKADEGIWFENEESLCERSGLNPPRKQKIQNILVGNLLVDNFKEQDLWRIFRKTWQEKKVGATFIRNACKNIEEERKKLGNQFNTEYQNVLNNPESTTNKKMLKLIKQIPDIANAIGQALNHSQDKISKYKNPFSLAQLYNIMETQRDGFSKNCKAVTYENSWRKMYFDEHNSIAFARQLPSDTVRPFDGVLARLMQRLAYEISEIKWKQIKQFKNADNIHIPIYIEENRFEFEIGLKEIKRRNIKDIKNSYECQQEKWEEKFERIKNSSFNICPYTGQSIGEHGEIDHIYPRSLSKRNFGTVFNGEINLIYCSSEGNRHKKQKHYQIKNLSPKYRKEVFQTENVDSIISFIEKNVDQIKKFINFDLLTKNQQKAAKHALFLERDNPAFKKVSKFLKNYQKTWVNGTQKYLAKKIAELLNQKVLQTGCNLSFRVKPVLAEDVSQRRKSIALKKEQYSKQDIQSFSSHAIDSSITLAQGLLSERQFKHQLQDDWLINNFLPLSVELVTIKSKNIYKKSNPSSIQLFKEKLYAEHFVPIWINQDKFAVGFSEKELYQLTAPDKKRLIKILDEFSTKDYSSVQKQEPKNKWRCFPINKSKALSFIHKCFHRSDLLTEDLDAIKLFNSLHYITLKETISKDHIIGKKAAKTAIKIESKAQDTLGSVKANLNIPAQNDWSRFLKSELVETLKNKSKISDSDLNQCLENYFLNKISEPNKKHKPVRKVFSLPVVAKKSGEMMRVTRETNLGEKIFQLQTASSPNMGLKIDNRKLIESDILIPFYKTKNLSPDPEKIIKKNTSNSEIIYFDNWQPITLNKEFNIPVIKLDIKLHSKGRRKIKIKQSFRKFIEVMKQAEVEGNIELGKHPLLLPNVLKIKNKLFDKFEPRGMKVTITEVGNIITYEFVLESTPAFINSLYIKEYLKHNETSNS